MKHGALLMYCVGTRDKGQGTRDNVESSGVGPLNGRQAMCNSVTSLDVVLFSKARAWV